MKKARTSRTVEQEGDMPKIITYSVLALVLFSASGKSDEKKEHTSKKQPTSTILETEVKAFMPRFYEVLASGNVSKIKAVTTDNGFNSLFQRLDKSMKSQTQFSSWARGWRSWPHRWVRIDKNEAEVWVGPESKAHTAILKFSNDRGWLLDRWLFGL
jgi:hypothetical protein